MFRKRMNIEHPNTYVLRMFVPDFNELEGPRLREFLNLKGF